MERRKMRPLHWAWAGGALGLLNALLMSAAVANRPIGASTAFPYLGSVLGGLRHAMYAKLIARPGLWEVWFLMGALLGAFVASLLAGDFKVRLVPERWVRVHGPSPVKRLFSSAVGAFLLIFGARMAGGCTSGHILSGIMQLSVSSIVFGIVVMSTFLVAGKLFYGR